MGPCRKTINHHLEGVQKLAETMKVIIDAGHGGADGGASTAGGVLEADLNLSISLKLDPAHFDVSFPQSVQ